MRVFWCIKKFEKYDNTMLVQIKQAGSLLDYRGSNEMNYQRSYSFLPVIKSFILDYQLSAF